MKLRVLLLATALAVPAAARDREFDNLVKAVESNCGIQSTRIPLLGVVNLVVKLARPSGTGDLKLAVFAHPAPLGEGTAFSDTVSAALGPGWRPFVRVESRLTKETTVIFSRVTGRRLHLLIATRERDEAVLMRFGVNRRALERWLAEPIRMAAHEEGAAKGH